MVDMGTRRDANGKQCDTSFPTAIPDSSCPWFIFLGHCPWSREISLVSVPTFYHPAAYSPVDCFQLHWLASYSDPNQTFKQSFCHFASQY